MISSSAPNGSSIRSRRGPPRSARAIETRCRMPPESSCGKLASQPSSPTSPRSSRGVGLPAGRALRAADLERQLDVLQRRAPRQQRRRPGTRSRATLEPRLLRRHAEHRDAAAGRRHEVGDDPQQGRLAAARTGPSRLRKPPRSSVKETFSSAVTVRRSVTKRTVTLRQETAAGSGTPSGTADGETPAAARLAAATGSADLRPAVGRRSSGFEGHDLVELRGRASRTVRARHRGRSDPARPPGPWCPSPRPRCGSRRSSAASPQGPRARPSRSRFGNSLTSDRTALSRLACAKAQPLPLARTNFCRMSALRLDGLLVA